VRYYVRLLETIQKLYTVEIARAESEENERWFDERET
jgi:hypothetical protein